MFVCFKGWYLYFTWFYFRNILSVLPSKSGLYSGPKYYAKSGILFQNDDLELDSESVVRKEIRIRNKQ